MTCDRCKRRATHVVSFCSGYAHAVIDGGKACGTHLGNVVGAWSEGHTRLVVRVWRVRD